LVGLQEKTIVFDDMPKKIRELVDAFVKERKPSENFSTY